MGNRGPSCHHLAASVRAPGSVGVNLVPACRHDVPARAELLRTLPAWSPGCDISNVVVQRVTVVDHLCRAVGAVNGAEQRLIDPAARLRRARHGVGRPNRRARPGTGGLAILVGFEQIQRASLARPRAPCQGYQKWRAGTRPRRRPGGCRPRLARTRRTRTRRRHSATPVRLNCFHRQRSQADGGRAHRTGKQTSHSRLLDSRVDGR